MKIKFESRFKDGQVAERFFESWLTELSGLSGTRYDRLDINSPLGRTTVWGINTSRTDLKTIVIFPGFRTSSLFWDIDNALQPLKKNYRIFMVETNGQPVLSDGNSPDVKTNDYGRWAAEVLKNLRVDKAVIAGASFGALVCLKLCMVAPCFVEKVVLLNPGCLQPFSLSVKNLYYNLLPLAFPRRKTVEKFLDKAIFSTRHRVSPVAKKLLIDYEYFAITQFRNKTQKPYAIPGHELETISSDVYIILGEKDLLFPVKKTIRVARKHIRTLRDIIVLAGTGHGIETSKRAHLSIARIISQDRLES